jgi:hypothetical protein
MGMGRRRWGVGAQGVERRGWGAGAGGGERLHVQKVESLCHSLVALGGCAQELGNMMEGQLARHSESGSDVR